MVFTGIVVVLVFGFMIFFHELGHFLAAKKAGVKVNEFALGMGPVLLKTQKGETTYALRLLPIGGFVSMEGEDSESGDAGAFCNKSPAKRFVIIAAGAFMNLLLGYVIMLALVMMSSGIATTEIHSFAQGATSNQYLQAGDKIVEINGKRIRTSNDISYELMREDDGIVDMVVVRDGQRVALDGVTFRMEEVQDGVKAIKLDFIVKGVAKNFWNVPVYAFDWTVSIVKQVWMSFVDLIGGRYSINQLSGPVGVATAIGEASGLGLDYMLILVAIITINLGIFNLLPIPALDGGRLVFLLIEAVRGKPVNPNIEGYINVAGLVALMGLMVLVTFNDIAKFFQ